MSMRRLLAGLLAMGHSAATTREALRKAKGQALIPIAKVGEEVLSWSPRQRWVFAKMYDRIAEVERTCAREGRKRGLLSEASH